MNLAKIFNILEYFDKKGVGVNIITNGQFDKSIVEKITNYSCISNISVSIDGNELENNFIRGNGSYCKAINFLNNLVTLKRFNLKVGINLTLNKLNYKSLELKEMIDLGIDYILINRIIENGRAKKELILNDDEYLDGIEKICIELNEFVRNGKICFEEENPLLLSYLNLKFNLSIPIKNSSCGAGKSVFYMDNQSNIYPCREIKETIDINKENITKYAYLLEKGVENSNPFCSNCEYVDECFQCPMKEHNRYKECEKVFQRLESFLRGLEGEKYKLNNNAIMLETSSELKFYDIVSNEECSVPICKSVVESINNDVFVCNDDLSTNDMIISLYNRGILINEGT